jgi:hypothetical protein
MEPGASGVKIQPLHEAATDLRLVILVFISALLTVLELRYFLMLCFSKALTI